jgi:hypothetical protein
VAIISNATTIADAGAFSVSLGDQVLIKSFVLDNVSSTITLVHGSSGVVLDDTYPFYRFVFTSIHPGTDNIDFQVNFRDGGSAYDAPKTTSSFYAFEGESTDSAFSYNASFDIAQGTGVQGLAGSLGNGNDESASGELLLFNPSSTTYIKHFMAKTQYYNRSNYSQIYHIGGYCNTTAAIDGVQFSASSGNIDSGTIKMYGIKGAAN